MTDGKRKEILHLLELDSRLSPKEIAKIIDCPEEETLAAIKQMEDERIICGYRTLINWEKVEDTLTAMVEIRVSPQGGGGYDQLADYISQFAQVETLYLMSGSYDFLVIIKGNNIKEISLFISSKLASINEVQSTTTHFILTKYKEEGAFFQFQKKDERMVITP